MAKPRGQRESRSALEQEWRLGHLRPHEVVAIVQADSPWPADISAEDREALQEEIRDRLARSRRDSRDRDLLREHQEPGRTICAAVPLVIQTAIRLEAASRAGEPPRQRAKALQLKALLRDVRRITTRLEQERRDAPSPALRAALLQAKNTVLRAYATASQEARQRPSRAASGLDAPRRALLTSLAWWWLLQGWTPTSHDEGCYLLVARQIERVRTGKEVAFNRDLVKAAMEEAKILCKRGDMLELTPVGLNDTPSPDETS